MSPEQHSREAESLLYNSRRQNLAVSTRMTAEAQVHATLAVAGYTAAALEDARRLRNARADG